MKVKISLFLFSLCLNLFAVDLQESLKKGDDLYEQREEIQNVLAAQKIYEEALAQNPKEPELMWRLSMVHYYIGHLDKDSDIRIKHYELGVDLGEKCVELSKAKPLVGCYFWLATNTALLKKEIGIFSLAFNISGIIDLFEEAKKIDPLYAGSGPYRMLALLYYKAPAILGGDNEKDFENMKLAIKNSPEEPLNYYFYVRLLIGEEQLEEAKKITGQFLEKPRPQSWPFFESKTAYKNLVVFYNTGKLPKKD